MSHFGKYHTIKNRSSTLHNISLDLRELRPSLGAQGNNFESIEQLRSAFPGLKGRDLRSIESQAALAKELETDRERALARWMAASSGEAKTKDSALSIIREVLRRLRPELKPSENDICSIGQLRSAFPGLRGRNLGTIANLEELVAELREDPKAAIASWSSPQPRQLQEPKYKRKSKLSAQEIKNRRAAGESVSAIALEAGISPKAVYAALAKKI
jgi:hypothetical protein